MPMETQKVIDQIKRGKKLLERAGSAVEGYAQTCDSLEKNLEAFEAHSSSLSKEDAALQSLLGQMGNLNTALEEPDGSSRSGSESQSSGSQQGASSPTTERREPLEPAGR